MKLEKRNHKEEMDSPLCLWKNPVPWISVFSLVLIVLAGFFGYSFLPIFLAYTVLILSSLMIFFNYSKQKDSNFAEKSAKDEVFDSPTCSSEDVEVMMVHGSISEEDEVAEKSHEPSSPIIQSESDSHGRSSTSEDSEVDWMFRSPDFSDGSISDEESLIEIALPGGHFVEHKQQEEEKLKPSYLLQKKKFQDFDQMGYSFFKQQSGFLEILAELNEMNEENLIEIDISMGSIMSPRFEIEA